MLQGGGGENPGNATLTRALGLATRRIAQARYYEQARRLAQIISLRFQQEERKDFVVVTGGGPGIREAASRWHCEVAAGSTGLNITIPREHAPNRWRTLELAIRYHSYAMHREQNRHEG